MKLVGLFSRIGSRIASWRFVDASADFPPAGEAETPSTVVVHLPQEPYVFECSDCGKVFEARRRRPLCPECDTTSVVLISE